MAALEFYIAQKKLELHIFQNTVMCMSDHRQGLDW
jgi:hypothetical protein